MIQLYRGKDVTVTRLRISKTTCPNFMKFSPSTSPATVARSSFDDKDFWKSVQFFVNRVKNVWNNLPQDTDFSSFNLFKCAIENMDFSQYLKYDK